MSFRESFKIGAQVPIQQNRLQYRWPIAIEPLIKSSIHGAIRKESELSPIIQNRKHAEQILQNAAASLKNCYQTVDRTHASCMAAGILSKLSGLEEIDPEYAVPDRIAKKGVPKSSLNIMSEILQVESADITGILPTAVKLMEMKSDFFQHCSSTTDLSRASLLAFGIEQADRLRHHIPKEVQKPGLGGPNCDLEI